VPRKNGFLSEVSFTLIVVSQDDIVYELAHGVHVIVDQC